MNLNKWSKILVGTLSVWPLLYIFVFFGFIAIMFVSMIGDGGQSQQPSGVPIAFAVLFAAHLGTILLLFALLVFYIVFLFKSDRVPQDKKALWAVVLFMGNALAMPVFFYIYVWPDEWPRPTKSGEQKRG
jgi:hypothetical protein